MSLLISALMGFCAGAVLIRWIDSAEINALNDLIKSLKKARTLRRVR